MDAALPFLQIFSESLRAASLLPYSETTLPAMVAFHGTSPLILLAPAALGALIGGMSSWGLGYLLARLRDKRPEFLPDRTYGWGVTAVGQVGWLFVPFYWMLFGSFLPLVAGFFRMRPWQVALCLIAGRLIEHFHGY